MIKCFDTEEQIVTKDNNDIYDCFRKCMDEFYRPAQIDKLLAEAYLIQIIFSSYRAVLNTNNLQDYGTLQQNPGHLVYRIMKYIDNNIYKQLTVSSIAENLGYSPYYISHIFKSKMNITLQNYIGDCKIQKSKELIHLKRFTLTEISEKIGYLNIQSFSRAFKKKTGIYPSVYLKKPGR